MSTAITNRVLKHAKTFNVEPSELALEVGQYANEVEFACKPDSKNNYNFWFFGERNVKIGLDVLESIVPKSELYDKIKAEVMIEPNEFCIGIHKNDTRFYFWTHDVNSLYEHCEYKGPLWGIQPVRFGVVFGNDGSEEIKSYHAIESSAAKNNIPWYQSTPLGFMSYPNDISTIYLEYKKEESSLLFLIDRNKSTLNHLFPNAPIPSHLKEKIKWIGVDYDEFKNKNITKYNYYYNHVKLNL